MSTTSTSNSHQPGGVSHWQALIDAMASAALVFDRNLVLLAQNAAHETMTDTQRKDVLGQYMFDAFPPGPDQKSVDTEHLIRESAERVWTEGRGHTLPMEQYALEDEDGTWQEHYWHINHSPIIEDGEVVAVLQISEDVTAQTLARNVYQAQRLAAQDAAELAYFSYDPGNQAFVRTPAVDKMFGFAPREAGPLADEFFARVGAKYLPEVNAELERVRKAELGTPARFDYTITIPATGMERRIRARGAMVIDPDDRRRKLVGVFIDMTDVELTRRNLEQALKDKEDLLVEVNHRVKNSLQLASSILRMEARKSSNADTQTVLETANSRIDAIAEVHGGIYLGGDVTRVATSTILNNMVSAMGRSVGAGDATADITLETVDFTLPTDRAIAFGLLTNELLTNAVKFGGGPDAAAIEVSTARTGDTATLRVANDYAGGDDPAGSGTGIGTSLINGFVRQLGGKLTQDTDGKRFVVSVTLDLSQI